MDSTLPHFEGLKGALIGLLVDSHFPGWGLFWTVVNGPRVMSPKSITLFLQSRILLHMFRTEVEPMPEIPQDQKQYFIWS